MMFESYPVVNFTTTGGVNKEEWFNNILKIINEMEIEDYILVYDFGVTGNCKLYIYLDDDYDIKFETDVWVDPDDGNDGELKYVDRTYIAQKNTKGLTETLERLWDEVFYGID